MVASALCIQRLFFFERERASLGFESQLRLWRETRDSLVMSGPVRDSPRLKCAALTRQTLGIKSSSLYRKLQHCAQLIVGKQWAHRSPSAGAYLLLAGRSHANCDAGP